MARWLLGIFAFYHQFKFSEREPAGGLCCFYHWTDIPNSRADVRLGAAPQPYQVFRVRLFAHTACYRIDAFALPSEELNYGPAHSFSPGKYS